LKEGKGLNMLIQIEISSYLLHANSTQTMENKWVMKGERGIFTLELISNGVSLFCINKGTMKKKGWTLKQRCP